MLRPNGVSSLRRLPCAGIRPLRNGGQDTLVQRRLKLPAPFISSPTYVQIREKKTKTTVNLADLPQGVLSSESLPEEDTQHEPAYPTVVLQARRNMQKFDNCVLLTRVGGFYELYFEHAEEYGPLLNLKVASKKTSAGPVPMVGSLMPWPM